MDNELVKGKSVGVIGAGIVGVATALELQRRGHDTTLIDRKAPGEETSYGNAGVLSDSSVLIMNNPGLFRQLPRMLVNKSLSVKFSWAFVLSRLPWLISYLSYSSKNHMHDAGQALRDLLVRSLKIHKELVSEAGAKYLIRDTGWLKVFRTLKGFESSAREQALLKSLGVSYSVLSSQEVAELEPALRTTFHSGLFFEECCSVTSPVELTNTYVQLFREAGGQVRRAEAEALIPKPGGGWDIGVRGAESIGFENVVVTAGPWSAEVCKWLGYRVPMAWERGYHMHLEPPVDGNLRRPILDWEGGFVMSPQDSSVCILTGVELTFRDAKPNFDQIDGAVAAARNVADFGAEVDPEPWMGRRPTLPDSLPMVGKAPRHDNLWFNFGHQHIGLATATGCALILSDLIEGREPTIPAECYRPQRFRL